MYRVRFFCPGFKTAKSFVHGQRDRDSGALDRAHGSGCSTEQVTVEANQEILQTPNRRLEDGDGATLSNQPLATRNYTSILGWKREPPWRE